MNVYAGLAAPSASLMKGVSAMLARRSNDAALKNATELASPSKKPIDAQPAATTKAQETSDAARLAAREPVRGLRQTNMDRFNEAFLSAKGDQNFNAEFDFDNDGEVGSSDLSLLNHIQSLGSAPNLTLEDLQGALFSSKGDKNFNPDADLDGDGEIGSGDLSLFSAGQNSVQSDNQAAILKRFEGAFNTTKGDSAFDSSLDLDGDGEVGSGDLSLLSRGLNTLYG